MYQALNLSKAPDAKMVVAPRQWYNSQPNTNWVQNVRHPVMPMNLPKIPPIPQNLPMQRNTFYPKWNQNVPSNTAAFVQNTLYNQKRHAQQPGQYQMKQQGYQQVKQQPKQQGQQRNYQKEMPKVEIRNSTAFVPLQAQKNSRNMSARQTAKETNATANSKNSSSPKTQQRQKKEEAPKVFIQILCFKKILGSQWAILKFDQESDIALFIRYKF